MVKLTTKSFRRSREFLDTPPDTPTTLAPNGEVPNTDVSDRDSTDSEADRHEYGPCTCNHDGRVTLSMDVGINIDELFTMMFTDSKFYTETIVQRNITEYDITGQWQRDPQTNLKTRQTTFTLPLSGLGLGPKEAYVTETQIMNKLSKPGVRYSIDVWAENNGVPYADSFNVLVHNCLERVSERCTRLTLYGQIKYKKTVWAVIKSFIEKGTLPNLDNYGRLLERLLTSYAGGGGHKRQGGRLRRHNTSSSMEGQVSRNVPAGPRGSISKPAAASGPRMVWILLMLLLLVAINAQLYFIITKEQSKPCIFNMDGWEERLNDDDSWEQMEEWADLLDQFTIKQREQLINIKHVLFGEIEALKRTEKSISVMIDKLKPTQKSRRDTMRRYKMIN